jgi:hypothetical protein
MYIISQIKQFSDIEEYVKRVLQISVHIIFNQKIICIHFLLEKFDLEFIENEFLITSLYLHEILIR